MTTKAFAWVSRMQTERRGEKTTTSNPSAIHKSMFYILPINFYWSVPSLTLPERHPALRRLKQERRSGLRRKCWRKWVELGSSLAFTHSKAVIRLFSQSLFRRSFFTIHPAFPAHELKKAFSEISMKIFHLMLVLSLFFSASIDKRFGA